MRVAENHHSIANSAVERRWLSRLAAPALLFLIVTLFYWKLVLTNQYTWLESPDLANQVLPWFQFQAGEWHQGRFPLWDPSGWFGQPLFGQGQPGAAYPPNWLLFLMPLRHGWMRQSVLHWYFVLIRYAAALACYALCRSLGRSRAASLIGGCLYALGGYVANTDWPQMVNGAVWSPLVFLFLFRAERREKPWESSLVSGFFLGLGWLAGHHQMNVMVSLAAAGVWIWLFVRQGRPDWSIARLAAASLAVAALTSGFQTVPMAEYASRAVRWVGSPADPVRFNDPVPYTVHEQYALKPTALLGIFVPNVAWQSNPFVGIVGFSLAILGSILAWNERQVRWLAVMGIAGFLFALGPNSVLHGVMYSLGPLVEKSRVPGAATLVFALAVAPLAAFGVDALPRPASYACSRRAGWVLAGICAVLVTASLMFFATKTDLVINDDRMLITALGAAAAAAVLAGWRGGGISARQGAAALLAMILLELANSTNYQLPHSSNPSRTLLRAMAAPADAVAYIRTRGDGGRLDYDSGQIPFNLGDWYGIETFSAYYASLPENVWRLEPFSARARDFFGVRYYLGKTPQWPDQREVFQSSSGFKVFESRTAYPRVWAVHRAVSLADPRRANFELADEKFDPRSTVFLTGQTIPDLGACASTDDVDMPIHRPNYVRITARMGCRGMVILTDTWFPGWRATVDGRSTEIVEAYGGVRGVIVEGGDHVVEMRYRPLSVFLGALMSLAAAGIVIAAVRGRRRREPRARAPAPL